MQKCAEHKDLRQDINQIKTDIALIKQRLLGDNGKRNGMIDKVDSHEKYFQMLAGGSAFVGFVFAAIKTLG